MAVFGIAGVLVASVILALWAWIFTWPKPVTGLEWLILLLVCVFVIALLLPGFQEVRENSRSTACVNNLKQIALAIIAHEATYGQFPPVHTVNGSNEPLLSWRVSLLPRLERQNVFSIVAFDEAWNGPNNLVWSTVPIDVYCCPSDASAAPTTTYFAVVGAQTAWPLTGVRRISDFTDGPEQTILLIEDHGRGVNWAEPKDLSFAEAVDLLSKPGKQSEIHRVHNGYFYEPTVGRSVVFADGSAGIIHCPVDRGLAEALLTVSGGDKIDARALAKITEPQLDYAKCYGFALFIVLSLLPSAWVGRRMQIRAQDNTR